MQIVSLLITENNKKETESVDFSLEILRLHVSDSDYTSLIYIIKFKNISVYVYVSEMQNSIDH